MPDPTPTTVTPETTARAALDAFDAAKHVVTADRIRERNLLVQAWRRAQEQSIQGTSNGPVVRT